MPVSWRGVSLTALLLSGCAGGYAIKPFNALSAEDALSEISSRRRLCDNFKSSVVFQFDMEAGQIRLNGEVTLTEGKYWRVSIDGPLGIKLVLIETDVGSYRLENLHTGQIQEGFLDEAVSLPELALELPSLDILGGIVLPVPDIVFPQDWEILSHTSNRMILREIIGDSPDSLILELTYSPLRILHEELWRDGSQIYKREYHYRDRKSVLPESISANIGSVEICIRYSNPKLRRERTPHGQLAPF